MSRDGGGGPGVGSNRCFFWFYLRDGDVCV